MQFDSGKQRTIFQQRAQFQTWSDFQADLIQEFLRYSKHEYRLIYSKRVFQHELFANLVALNKHTVVAIVDYGMKLTLEVLQETQQAWFRSMSTIILAGMTYSVAYDKYMANGSGVGTVANTSDR